MILSGGNYWNDGYTVGDTLQIRVIPSTSSDSTGYADHQPIALPHSDDLSSSDSHHRCLSYTYHRN